MKLNAKNGKLYLDDEEFFLVSGDLHYFRVHPSQWDERLALMTDFGLNTVQTYCPWNLHEPKRGVFDFKGPEGLLDLGAFLDRCAAHGLKVLLRPAPFICSECDFGGLPGWLSAIPGITLRSTDPLYVEPLREYYAELCRVIVPRLSTHGGPILAVALENEFGGISNDRPYLQAMADIMTGFGVDVPYYTTDGTSAPTVYVGTLDSCIMSGLNYRALPNTGARVRAAHDAMYPERPFFVGELWGGRAIYWGEGFRYRPPQETADAFREALEAGAYVNFYMFSGGTNFGSFSGGLIGKSFGASADRPVRYIAHTTSYDEDSLIGEDGAAREKYYLCREVLDRYLGREVRPRPAEPFRRPAQAIGRVALTEAAPLFDNLDVLTAAECDSVSPLTMEALGENFGFVLYTATVPSFGMELESTFALRDVRDRATVYANGQYVGTVIRDRESAPLKYTMPKEGCEVAVLVENVSRINSGQDMYFEHKGVIKDIRFRGTRIVNWKNRALPMTDVSGLRYAPLAGAVPDDMPVFLRGTFDALPGVDTFVLTDGFTRGHIRINGFNLGRYWNVGPQRTLYVPGALLKAGGNVIEILDVSPHEAPSFVSFTDNLLLEGDPAPDLT